MNLHKNTLLGALAIILLSACGGGGGTSGAVPPTGPPVIPTSTPLPPGATPTPIPTPTPVPNSVSGRVVDRNTQAALSGFTVTVGSVPDSSNCLNGQSATSQPCGVPAAPFANTVTAADGTFSVSGVTPGLHMVTIGKDGTYATLHAQGTLITGSNNLGTFKLTALNSTKQAWLADLNNQRANVSVPVSFANLVVDEYAQEQADAWSADVTAGRTTFGDTGYGSYQTAYGSSPGAMYGAGGVLYKSSSPAIANDYVTADNSWFGEKSSCPSGNWQTCPFTGSTGHYINVSNTRDVWVGLGLLPTPDANGFYYYNVMIVQNTNGTAPAGFRRASALPIHKI